MQKKLPNYILNSPWDAPAKIESRSIGIINVYRNLYGRDTIPHDEQYWSLCGSHSKDDVKIDGEFGHLTSTGLVQPHQYFGVDREEIVIQNNQKYYPGINWIEDDFRDALEHAFHQGTFNPAIINYDGVMQPRNGIAYVKRILDLIDSCVGKELLFVTNYVLKNPYTSNKKFSFTIDDTIKYLDDMYIIPDYLHIIGTAYQYPHNNTNMGMIIFVKEPHNINQTVPPHTKNRILG